MHSNTANFIDSQLGKKDAYVAQTKVFAEVAKNFGALENLELDVLDSEHTNFQKTVKALPGEK